MVVLLLVWAGGHAPDARRAPAAAADAGAHPLLATDALGWLRGTALPGITAIAVLVGLGHSFLAMSGWESLAQVYREIEHPKPLNLRRAGLVIFVYSVIFTASVSFLAVALIPDARALEVLRQPDLRPGDAPGGPAARSACCSRASSCVVGFLILAGAVQHGHRRLERRGQPGLGRRRAARLVPQAAPEVRHHLPDPERDRRPAAADAHRSAAATSTCWARRTRSASSGASRSRASRCSCCATRSPARASGGCRSTCGSAASNSRSAWR